MLAAFDMIGRAPAALFGFLATPAFRFSAASAALILIYAVLAWANIYL